MLQQTQVERVIPKYTAFLARFPTAAELGAAPFADVLRFWSGLGYNGRARKLWEAATVMCRCHQGLPPRDEAELRSLPGIGRYTAAAVASFAFGARIPAVDQTSGACYLALSQDETTSPNGRCGRWLRPRCRRDGPPRGPRPNGYRRVLLQADAQLREMPSRCSVRLAKEHKARKFSRATKTIRFYRLTSLLSWAHYPRLADAPPAEPLSAGSAGEREL